MAKKQLKQTFDELQQLLTDVGGLNEFASTLGDKKLDGKWSTSYQTVNESILPADYGKVVTVLNLKNNQDEPYTSANIQTYGDTSTFSGWMGYIGTPSEIKYIKVPSKLAASTNTSAGDAPTQIRITIFKVPPYEEIKDKLVSGEIRNWKDYQLFQEIHDLSQPLTSEWAWQKIKLDTPFVNKNKDMLMLCYDYNAICGVMCLSIVNSIGNYPMGYNVWTYYTTARKTVPTTFPNLTLSGLYASKPKSEFNLYSIPVIIGDIDVSSTFYDLKTEEGGNFYNKVSEVIDNKNINGGADDVQIMLPKSYDLVVGDQFQLFFRSVIKCYGDYQRYGINCKCSKGTFYPDYFEYTPTVEDVGQKTLTIYLRNLSGKVILEQSTTLNIHKVPVINAPVVKNICAFGDSLTSGGTWVAEGVRRLVGTADSGFNGPQSLKVHNLTLDTFGTKKTTDNTQFVRYEGYGGWTWNTFLSNSETSTSTINALIVTTSTAHGLVIDNVQKSVWVDNNGLKWELENLPSANTIKFNRGPGNNGQASSITTPTTMTCSSPQLSITVNSTTWESGNPFWNINTNKVDFKNWAAAKGCPQIDIAACLLTWNAGGARSDSSGYTYQGSIEAHMNDAKKLLRQLHSDYPNAKVICLGIQIPSLTGGTGSNYGAGNYYGDMWGTACYAWDYDKALEELCLSDEFKSYCYYVDTKGQFDTIHNMPSKTEPVNCRNTITYSLGTNGVHPAMSGYYQIGDAFFRKLVAIIDEENN